ncbi:hypothetical protein NE236_26520 [Actinoallomurus purpureus]|uniref:hypothetical protein n=1 Tax=Actinoallomurus purpureus TaxID=478114 RepID=UPI0020925C84|nr:hypothetical protein [Actinoallomurus purpureus]MCO6008532.1 hypothetical protein [Actinoallomurus purpureus]
MATASPPSADAQQVVTVPCIGPSGGAAGLVTAIQNANTAGHGTINLAANCNYDFTAPTDTTGTRGGDALPIIRGDITILGGPSTHIRRTGGPAFRLFEVAAGARLLIRGIFIEGGDSGTNTGGAILSARGTVVLKFVTVRYNTADNGAGLSNDSGTMVLYYTVVTSNTTRHLSGAGGGGAGIYSDGRLDVKFSVVSLNTANTSGGGVYAEQGGTATFYRTTLSGNVARFNGGGLLDGPGGRATLVLTLVEHNSAGNGGGIFRTPASGPVILFNSVVAANNPNNCRPVGSIAGCS